MEQQFLTNQLFRIFFVKTAKWGGYKPAFLLLNSILS